MAPECRPCADLTLEELVLLVGEEELEVNSRAFGFPYNAYELHPSFAHLEQAAADGCNFCRLIVDCLKGTTLLFDRDTTLWSQVWERLEDDDEQSMYNAAKRLDVSDVKLALGCSTEHPSITLSPCVLDVMLVQVGMEISDGDPDCGEISYYERRMPSLRLTLTAPRGCTTNINGYQIGRNQLDPDLASDVNHGIARDWLEECRSSHTGCVSSETPQLPTRVVDVGTSNLDTARVIHSDGLAAEYMALSHCWGGDIPTKLTTKTFSQFQQALPQAELPANFRDSIIIARQLGIRYLWIDSLCILQDSAQDWEQESQRMTNVYGNATLTLSAAAASGSSVGLLNNYHIPTPIPPSITLRIRPCDPPSYHIVAHREDLGEESLSTLTTAAPLNQRGWALQESVLSRRILFYGARQIYWSCRQGYHAADGTCQLENGPGTQFPLISNLLHSSTTRTPDQIESFLQEYYRIVQAYSCRTLTISSDKLPALAGLTRRLRPALVTEYLAGLWLSDIHRGLLWSHRQSRQGGFAPHVVPARAPSWSWAVTDEPVDFKFGRLINWGCGTMMEVCKYEVVVGEAGDGFGEIVAGRLVVNTRLMELVRSEQNEYPPRFVDDVFGFVYYDEVRGDGRSFQQLVVMEGFVLSVHFVNEMDRGEFEMDREAEMERGYFLMFVHADEGRFGIGRETSTNVKCLVVRRVEGGKEMEFERVGMAEVLYTEAAWLDTWEQCVLTLV